MRNEAEDSVELWRQFASAVEYIEAVERPGFSVWDALIESLRMWLGMDSPGSTVRSSRSDALREVLKELCLRTAPVGVPGGADLATAIAAALASWLHVETARLNDGYQFQANNRVSTAGQ